MVRAQDLLLKHAVVATPASITSSAELATSIGTSQTMPDCDFIVAVIIFGAVTTNTASNGITALKVQGSDDDSSYTDIHDFFSPGSGTAYAAASSDDFKWLIATIDVRHKKHKYVKFAGTITGTSALLINGAFFLGVGNRAVPPTANLSSNQLVAQSTP